ncbi:hypothetical protein Nepgr_010417 [Nepenthes gracilis]|uniref:Uncharacterized protein n=1 Tax=Nepenthes gracilis TaxID=150966 RepID=A0AAD3XL19_NEPGR|nr:hypothetical protein Nepgr_010417 [Nepenthes gracilis]
MERLNFARVCVEVTKGAHLPSVIRLKSGSEAAASAVDIEVSYLRKPMHPLKGHLANPGLGILWLMVVWVRHWLNQGVRSPRRFTRHTFREMLAMHDAACKRERARRRRKAASRKPKVPKEWAVLRPGSS